MEGTRVKKTTIKWREPQLKRLFEYGEPGLKKITIRYREPGLKKTTFK